MGSRDHSCEACGHGGMNDPEPCRCGAFIEAEQFTLAQMAIVVAEAMERTGTTEPDLVVRIGANDWGARRVASLLAAEGNPSLKLIARVAEAMGQKVVVRFVPVDQPVDATGDLGAENPGHRAFFEAFDRPGSK